MKVSSGSSSVSPLTGTVMVLVEVSPGAKVTVPLMAVVVGAVPWPCRSPWRSPRSPSCGLAADSRTVKTNVVVPLSPSVSVDVVDRQRRQVVVVMDSCPLLAGEIVALPGLLRIHVEGARPAPPSYRR